MSTGTCALVLYGKEEYLQTKYKEKKRIIYTHNVVKPTNSYSLDSTESNSFNLGFTIKWVINNNNNINYSKSDFKCIPTNEPKKKKKNFV